MSSARIRQIVVKCRGDQAQVWASAFIDSDTIAIDPHKSIRNERQQGFKFLLERFLAMVVFVEQDTDVASQMAHQFFNDTTADAVGR